MKINEIQKKLELLQTVCTALTKELTVQTQSTSKLAIMLANIGLKNLLVVMEDVESTLQKMPTTGTRLLYKLKSFLDVKTEAETTLIGKDCDVAVAKMYQHLQAIEEFFKWNAVFNTSEKIERLRAETEGLIKSLKPEFKDHASQSATSWLTDPVRKAVLHYEVMMSVPATSTNDLKAELAYQCLKGLQTELEEIDAKKARMPTAETLGLLGCKDGEEVPKDTVALDKYLSRDIFPALDAYKKLMKENDHPTTELLQEALSPARAADVARI
jgi:hypothetical protein